MRIDDFSALSETFVACVSASVATVDCCPGNGRTLPTARQRYRFGFCRTQRGRHGLRISPGCRDGRRPADSIKESYTGDRLARDTGPTASSPASPGSLAPPTVKLSSDSSSTRTHRHTATASGIAPPAVNHGFGPGGALRPSARRANTPPRIPRPRPAPPTTTTPAPAASSVPTVPIPSDHDRPEPVGTPLLRLTPPPGDKLTATIKLDALVTPLNSVSLIPSRVIRMPIGSENSSLSRRATP